MNNEIVGRQNMPLLKMSRELDAEKKQVAELKAKLEEAYAEIVEQREIIRNLVSGPQRKSG